MAKFNKAFIPLGISGAFVAFGLVGSLAINAAYNAMYVPEDIVIEDAGGEDVVASNPEELKAELLKVKIYSGDYYDSLKEETSDPEPAEGYYNSVAITCEGGDSSFNRKLIVTQNQAGAFYQYSGYATTSGKVKVDQNALIGFSRHGMFMKFNDYKVSSEDPEADLEIQKVFEDAVSKHRGKWYKVATHIEPSFVPTPGMTEDDYYRMMASYTTAMTADSWYNTFKNDLNGNKTIIDQMISILENVKEEDKKSDDYWSGTYSGISYSVSFSNKSKPKFTLSAGGENEEIVIEHINNTKVRIVESGDGDFNDLLDNSLYEYYKKTMASA